MEQLALDFPTPDRREMKTVAALGLRRDCPPGPARLLRELVKRGLTEDALHSAAALALVLDEGPTEQR